MAIGLPDNLNRVKLPTSGASSAGTSKSNRSHETSAAAPQTTRANEGKGSTIESSTQVSLSGGLPGSALASSAHEAIDSQRVEKLRAEIAGGTFKVNAEVVADRLLSSSVEALDGREK